MKKQFSFNEIKELCNELNISIRFKDMKMRTYYSGFGAKLLPIQRIQLFFKKLFRGNRQGVIPRERFEKYGSTFSRGNEACQKVAPWIKAQGYYASIYTLSFITPWGQVINHSHSRLENLLYSIDFDAMPHSISKKILYLPYDESAFVSLSIDSVMVKLKEFNAKMGVVVKPRSMLRKYWIKNKASIYAIAVHEPDSRGIAKRSYLRSQKDYNKLKLARFKGVDTFIILEPKKKDSMDIVEKFSTDVLDYKHVETKPSIASDWDNEKTIQKKHVFTTVSFRSPDEDKFFHKVDYKNFYYD